MSNQVKRFRLNHGIHSEGGKIYRKGDIVESVSDLTKHNKGSNRFVSADDVAPAQAVQEEDDDLKELTVDELRSMAEEGDIDLSGITRKDAIIEAIKQAEG